MKALFIIIFFCAFTFCNLVGQARFQGAGLVGLTMSQIDGDDLVGFNKLGVSAGIKVRFKLKSKLDGNVEFLYSQRGSSTNLFSRDAQDDIININYFELPIYLTINDWYIEKDDYYKMSGHAGLSYGNIVTSSIQNTNFTTEMLSNADISYLVGATFYFNKKLALTARYTRSFNRLFSDETARPIQFLLGYFWTVRVEYYF